MVKLLDCTLRDGGYYTNWEFSKELVMDYLHCMDQCGVDAIEIGFRTLGNSSGQYCHIDDCYLSTLLNNFNKNIIVAIMINAKDFIIDNKANLYMLSTIIRESRHSNVKMIRIAVNYKHALLCKPLIDRLKDMGYITSINLMQINLATLEEKKEIINTIHCWENLDILYIADSLGNIQNIEDFLHPFSCSLLRDKIGFHAHDNTSRANYNTINALDKWGLKWIDGTILGMGRGAGNAQTEYLLAHLEHRACYNCKYTTKGIQNLIIKHFLPLKEKYQWGHNLYYYVAACNNIHPTYIQNFISAGYNENIIMKAIKYLKDNEGHIFRKDYNPC